MNSHQINEQREKWLAATNHSRSGEHTEPAHPALIWGQSLSEFPGAFSQLRLTKFDTWCLFSVLEATNSLVKDSSRLCFYWWGGNFIFSVQTSVWKITYINEWRENVLVPLTPLSPLPTQTANSCNLTAKPPLWEENCSCLSSGAQQFTETLWFSVSADCSSFSF